MGASGMFSVSPAAPTNLRASVSLVNCCRREMTASMGFSAVSRRTFGGLRRHNGRRAVRLHLLVQLNEKRKEVVERFDRTATPLAKDSSI